MPKRKEPITPADRQYNTRNNSVVQEDWIEQCKANDHKLSTWEIDFLESIESQMKAGRELSERQAEILERIYDKI